MKFRLLNNLILQIVLKLKILEQVQIKIKINRQILLKVNTAQDTEIEDVKTKDKQKIIKNNNFHNHNSSLNKKLMQQMAMRKYQLQVLIIIRIYNKTNLNKKIILIQQEAARLVMVLEKDLL